MKDNLNRILDQIDAELARGEANKKLALQSAELRSRLSAQLEKEGQTNELLIKANSPRPSLLDDAIALEVEFAVAHPLAERLMREFINSLS